MTSGTAVPVLVTLHGPEGRLDSGVGDGTTPRDLVADATVRAGLGLVGEEPAVLLTRTGRPLKGDVPLVAQGVADGSVLLATATARAPVPSRPTGGRRAGRVRPSTRPPSQGLAALAVLALCGAGLLAAPAGGAVSTVTATVLLLVAGTAAVTMPPDEWGDRVRLLAPASAACGIWALVYGPGPAQAHLALTAAAVTAAVAVALARNGAQERAVGEVLLVLLVLTCVLAVASGVGLLAGAPLRGVGALLAAFAVLSLRVLPSLVIDVPDEALLELDRLSVTAWSAHERAPRGVWQRVRAADVLPLVARGRRQYESAVVGVTVLATAGSFGVLADPGTGVAPYGSPVMAASCAVAMLLAARTVRGAAGRVSLRVGGGLLAAALCCAGMAAAGTLGRAVAAGGAALVGGVVVVAAVALGRGWRSARWGRTADLLEAFALALVLPAGLVAAGGAEWVRQLAS